MLSEIMATLTILTGLIYIYFLVKKRWTKEQIFYLLYTVSTFLLLILVLSFFELQDFILPLYFILLFIIHQIYSWFYIYYFIKEFFLKLHRETLYVPKIQNMLIKVINERLSEAYLIEKKLLRKEFGFYSIVDAVLIITGLLLIFLFVYFIKTYWLAF